MSYNNGDFDDVRFSTHDLNTNELEVITRLIQEALAERVTAYINKFGVDGADQFIKENTKTMPIVQKLYLQALTAIVEYRMGRRE